MTIPAPRAGPRADARVHLGCISLSPRVLQRPLVTKQLPKHAGILWTRRDTAGQTDLDRTQEVAGSSPASSTFETPVVAGVSAFRRTYLSGSTPIGHQLWASNEPPDARRPTRVTRTVTPEVAGSSPVATRLNVSATPLFAGLETPGGAARQERSSGPQ
jgi:hypothetical protein